MTVASRPKILGIGYPKFAVEEFNALAEKYEIHWFHPDDRAQVISEVQRLSDEYGPFDASWVVSDARVGRAESSYTILRGTPRSTRRCSVQCSGPAHAVSSPRAELVSPQCNDSSS